MDFLLSDARSFAGIEPTAMGCAVPYASLSKGST